MSKTTELMIRAWLAVTSCPADSSRRDERGDVPGWVLITVMTAAVVMVLLGVAREVLPSAFRSAVESVKGP